MNSWPETRESAPRRPRSLWVFAPGLGPVARRLSSRLPALERLVARGRRRPVAGDPWAAVAGLFGGDTKQWPVGPVSCLGDGETPRGHCLRVEPLGMDENGTFRIPGGSLGITPDEACALAQRFDDVLADDGLALRAAAPGRWYLVGAPAWAGAPGPPPAPLPAEEPALLRLVSEAEMLFHDHPVNRAREAAAAPRVAGMHPWGGGRLSGPGPAEAPAGWGDEPYLAGLLALAGGSAASRPDKLFEEGGVAWACAPEDPADALPSRLEQEIAEGALRALSRGRLREVRLVTEDAVYVTTRWAARLPWRRPRPLGESL